MRLNWKDKPQVGVVGHTGMVGSQVFSYFKSRGFKVFGYSRSKKNGFPRASWEEINGEASLIFVCVPTPYDFTKRNSNFLAVENVLEQIKEDKIVVIKSTIWPGTTDRLQKKFPHLSLIFNPEFLSRKSARRDFEKPDRQIVGYTNKSQGLAQEVLLLLPRGEKDLVMKAKEAELVKYAHNVYGTLRIIWANQLYEICEKLNIDYEKVKEGFAASQFIGPGILRYMTIFHDGGKRGVGGPCFPKDLLSFIEFCKSIGIDAELPLAARRANLRILKKQGLTEKLAEKIL